MATADNVGSPNVHEHSVLSTWSTGSSISSNSSGNTSVSALHDFITTKVKGKKGTIKSRKIQKKWKKNKISKEDFCNKTVEFRMWLLEEKNIRLDDLPGPKAREWFKKFVKKWNGKKLPQKYYHGADPYWAVSSPGAYSRINMPGTPDVEALDETTVPLTSFTPLYEKNTFGTFGKRAGIRALQEVQTPTVPPGDHVYDQPLKAAEKLQTRHSEYENSDPDYIPPKARPLLDLFSGPHPDMLKHRANQLGGARKLVIKGIQDSFSDELDTQIPAADNSHQMLDISCSTPVNSGTEPLYAQMDKGRSLGTKSSQGPGCDLLNRAGFQRQGGVGLTNSRTCSTVSSDPDSDYVPIGPVLTGRDYANPASISAGEYITFIKPSTVSNDSTTCDSQTIDSGDYVTLTKKKTRKRAFDKSEENDNQSCKIITSGAVFV